MSSASVPAPRANPPSASRHTLFWPFLILLVAVGVQAVYQIEAMEDHLDEVTRAVDRMDDQVKDAQRERMKFYALARDVLNLAPNDPTAEKIVVKFKIREMKAASPTLFDGSATAPPVNELEANTMTNTAPLQPIPTTTLAPLNTGTVPVRP
jgi:hypothetical protein